jgi:putative ABC transport system ATP-binding protein
MSAISLSDVKFSYSSRSSLILDIVSLQVPIGARAFVFGPSGSGKSTLLGLIAGILTPGVGDVEVFGTKLNSLSEVSRDDFRGKNLGFIFQQFNLIPYLTVRENIMLPFTLGPLKKDLRHVEDDLLRLCDELGISQKLDQSVLSLSVGQQQRVAAVRSMICKPKLLIADEPTSALDADHRFDFIKSLSKLCQDSRTTVLFVSHDRSLEQFFDLKIDLASINRAPQVGRSMTSIEKC